MAARILVVLKLQVDLGKQGLKVFKRRFGEVAKAGQLGQGNQGLDAAAHEEKLATRGK